MAISNSTDRFNGYVASLAVKVPCVAAATSNITLSGEQTISGIAVVADDRVLVAGQTNAVENGIYLVKSSAWERAPDFDGTRDATENSLVLVARDGQDPVFYKVDTAEPFVIGTTALSFSVLSFGGSGDVEAGAGSLADRVAFWSDTTTITGDAGLTYTTSPDTLTVDGTIVTDDITAVGAGGVNIENSTPTLWIDDTDTGVSDETTWSVRADQGTFYISTVDDARTGQTSALIMTRSGTDPVAATFNGMDLTVTSGELRVASTQPDFVLEETDQATDEGEYYMRASGGALRIGAQADSGSRPTGGVFLEFDRTGTNADIVKLYADELNGNGQEFVDFKYRDHLGAVKTNAISSGVYSINYAIDGAFYTVELTENITSWSVSIPSNISSIPGYIEIILRIYQDTTGGRTVSWSGWSTASVLGGSLRWANGTAPTLSTAATTGPLKDRIMDIITMKSFDGGIVWYGDYSVGYDTV